MLLKMAILILDRLRAPSEVGLRGREREREVAHGSAVGGACVRRARSEPEPSVWRGGSGGGGKAGARGEWGSSLTKTRNLVSIAMMRPVYHEPCPLRSALTTSPTPNAWKASVSSMLTGWTRCRGTWLSKSPSSYRMSRVSSSWLLASTSPGYMTPRPAQFARTKSPISKVVSGASTEVGGACVSEMGVRNGPGSTPSLARSQGISRGGVPAFERKQKKHFGAAAPVASLAGGPGAGCATLSAIYQKRPPETERRRRLYCTPPAPLYVYLGTPSLSPLWVYTPLTAFRAAPDTK